MFKKKDKNKAGAGPADKAAQQAEEVAAQEAAAKEAAAKEAAAKEAAEKAEREAAEQVEREAAEAAARKEQEEVLAAAARADQEAREAAEREAAEQAAAEGAARKAAPQQAPQEQKPQQAPQEQKPRGPSLAAPSPSGAQGSMDLGNQRSMRTAFNMLDKKKEGVLDLQHAKLFLRSAGWVIADEALDARLEKSFRERAGLRGVRMKVSFNFEQLQDILQNLQDEKVSNSGVPELQEALTKLARYNSGMTRQQFHNLVMEGLGLQKAEVEQLLAVAGISDREDQLDVAQLAEGLMGAVCRPPSSLETQKLQHKPSAQPGSRRAARNHISIGS